MNLSEEPQVIVVGGGIGGLSTALALTLKGLKVRVLESSSTFGEVGAGLQIAPNCTRVLDRWGLLDEVKSLGVLPENIIMKDAVTGAELTRLDLADVEKRYGFPYMVIHRSDLHGALLRGCERAGVDLVTDTRVADYIQGDGGAYAIHADGREFGEVVIAADGLHSVARQRFSHDKPVSSAYVAYRGAIPIDQVARDDVHLKDVVCYIGPKCHFVQYPLRQGEMLNQVAVFESAKALDGDDDWGTPDELDSAFAGMCDQIQRGLPLMWRDRWWRMFDRYPISNWVSGRVALTGDAAHPPLQYLAQGAVMAIEDAWVLSEHVGSQIAGSALHDGIPSGIDWEAVLASYEDIRPEHCRRVVLTARNWGKLWHLADEDREWRNDVLKSRDIYDYTYVDWLFGPTALTLEQEAPLYPGGETLPPAVSRT